MPPIVARMIGRHYSVSTSRMLPKNRYLLSMSVNNNLRSFGPMKNNCHFGYIGTRHFSDKGPVKIEKTSKKMIIQNWNGNHQKYWMSSTEYTGVVVGKDDTNGEYVISDGIIGPGGFIPDHYHKWEDQTFHVISGQLEAKIGQTSEEFIAIGPGDTIHCPRGISHYIRNVGTEEAKLISYIFPGHWAEDFMDETSKQNHTGKQDLKFIEDKFGVVYI